MFVYPRVFLDDLGVCTSALSEPWEPSEPSKPGGEARSLHIMVCQVDQKHKAYCHTHIYIHTYTYIYIYTYYMCVYLHRFHYIPVVPHKAVAEVSKIGNL